AQARAVLSDLDGAKSDLAMAVRQARTPVERYVTFMTGAQLAIASERWLDARDELKKAITSHPAAPYQTHVNLAQVYRKRKDTRAAVAELDRAIALRMDDRRLHYTRAQVYLDMGDLASARRDFEEAVKGDVAGGSTWRASALVGLGYVKHQAGEYDD